MPTQVDTADLNQAFGNLASTILKERMMQTERQHYGQERQDKLTQQAMENQFRQKEIENQGKTALALANWRNAQATEVPDKAKQTEDIQRVKQKQAFLHAAMSLNATGQMDESTRKDFNDWLASDPDMSATGMQIQKPVNPKTGQKNSALEATVSAIKQYRAQAAEAEKNGDTDAATENNHYADLLEKNLPSAVKSTPSAKPSETKITTGISPTTGTAYGSTNQITYGNAPAIPGQAAPPQKVLRYNPATGMVE